MSYYLLDMANSYSLVSQKYGLAIHTTTPQLAICLDDFAGDSRKQIWELGRDLSSSLHYHIQEILAPQTWQDIGFVAVAKGPGGFTGTRIGVVAARTLGQQLDIPVYGVSTLAAIAHQQLDAPELNSLVAVVMPTRREQLFTAIYRVEADGIWTEYQSDKTTTQAEWDKVLANLEQPWQLVEAPTAIASSVTSVMALAYAQWQQQRPGVWQNLVPFYGQHPV